MKLSVIGCGNMATALLGGLFGDGSSKRNRPRVSVSDPDVSQCKRLAEKYPVEIAESNVDCVRDADFVLLAVKPQTLDGVAAELRDTLPDGAVLISILAGQTLERLENCFGKGRKIVRVMPNTPALVGEGMAALCKNAAVAADEFAFVKDFLGACGEVIELSEDLMDSFTSLAGSAPAYVFMMIDAMTREAVREGMPYEEAKRAAAQTVLGAAKMVLESADEPQTLKERVCSPGGTTIEGVAVLEEARFIETVMAALRAASEKAKKL